jgi:hypothetical protein
MVFSGRVVPAVLVTVLVVAGCSDPPVSDDPVALPEIAMTSGGGFETSSQRWTIAPDGSWTWTREDKGNQVSPAPPRTGKLTEPRVEELAVLATEPALRRELRRGHRSCDISDGSSEHLDVGSLRYLASWCPEDRPHIRRLRERIVSLTTGP